MLPETWTGELVGKMHNNRITLEMLANELGVTKNYISMILNGHRKPPDIQRRLEKALDEVISRQMNC